MKLLIGVDGTDGSFEALRWATYLADPTRDEGVMYYAPPRVTVTGSSPGAQVMSRVRQSLADAVFDAAEAQLPESWRGRFSRKLGDSASPGIIAAESDLGADLVLIGAQGSGPWGEEKLGSVARGVIHASKQPVLAARPRRSPDGPLRVLVAADGSPASAQIAAAISRFAWAGGVAGSVVRVTEPYFAGQLPAWLEKQTRDAETEAMSQVWVAEHAQEKEQTRQAMLTYSRTLPPGFHDQVHVIEGHAGEQIVALSDKLQVDLIVIGARGKGMLERLLLGSTSAYILAAATCAVLVVRQGR